MKVCWLLQLVKTRGIAVFLFSVSQKVNHLNFILIFFDRLGFADAGSMVCVWASAMKQQFVVLVLQFSQRSPLSLQLHSFHTNEA